MEARDRQRGQLPYLSALFAPGERHLVKGKLCFDEDSKSLEFEKEFVAPQDRKIDEAKPSVPPTSPVATSPPGASQQWLPKPTTPEFPAIVKPPKKPRAPGKPWVTPPAGENPLPKGPLSGTWRASAGALFRIADDGTTAKVKLLSGQPLHVFSGELTRRDGDRDAKVLSGTFDAVFRADAPRRHSIGVTATLDDSGQLHLRCTDWPVWNSRGKSLGTKTLSETWTRSNEASVPGSPVRNPIRPGSANDEPLAIPSE
jgi:hypothetical protein